MIKINCSRCDKEFEKRLGNYNYGKKHRNNIHFCSKSCRSTYLQPRNMIKVKCNGCGNEFEMRSGRYTSRHKENNGVHYCTHSCYHKYKPGKSPFGYFIEKCRYGNRWEYNIDSAFLEEVWKKQSGICPYTGIKMILPDSKRSFRKCRSIEKPSLDRIDTTKGYIKGNVEFVCQGINFAKHDYSKEEVLQFINKIKSPLQSSI